MGVPDPAPGTERSPDENHEAWKMAVRWPGARVCPFSGRFWQQMPAKGKMCWFPGSMGPVE
jgi:hypothetical protein